MAGDEESVLAAVRANGFPDGFGGTAGDQDFGLVDFVAAEDLAGDVGSLGGTFVRAGKDEGRFHADVVGLFEDRAELFAARVGEGAVGIGDAGFGFVGDAVAEDVDLHNLMVASFQVGCAVAGEAKGTQNLAIMANALHCRRVASLG